MKEVEISFSDLDKLPEVAKTILQLLDGKKIVAFRGDMGAGKTTLIKELCRQLGSKDVFSSPTYSVVNEYLIESSGKEKIYHMDLFRLKNLEEALNIGVEEYLNSNSFCFIEWYEIIESLLPDKVVKIYIRYDENVRNLSIFSN